MSNQLAKAKYHILEKLGELSTSLWQADSANCYHPSYATHSSRLNSDQPHIPVITGPGIHEALKKCFLNEFMDIGEN